MPATPSFTPDRAAKYLCQAVGTEFILKKTVVSSTIKTATATDISLVSTGGALYIVDAICQTDGSTGLAGGTALQILTNNANGVPVFFQTAISGLGAAKTIDLANASVTKLHAILEAGKKLQVQSTIADCTGAGTVDIYIRFMRLADYAWVTNA